MRRRSLPFRWHLAISGILVVVPVLIAGAGISYRYVASERRSLERGALETARDVGTAIDRHLDGVVVALKTLRLSAYLHQDDLAGFHRQARQVQEIFPGSVIALRDQQGQQVVNTAVEWGAPLPRSSDPVLLRADGQAIAGQAPVVSDLYTGAATGKLFVAVDVPVMLAGRAHLLNLAIPPENILAVTNQSRSVPPDWLLIVLDREGRVIARSREQERFVGTRGSPDFLQQLVASEGTFRSATLDGEAVLDAYTRSAVAGWTIVAAVPLEALSAPLIRAGLLTAAIAAIGILASFGIGMWYAGYVTPPVDRLRQAALALGSKQPVVPFRTGVTELDAVSAALATASRDLQQHERANAMLINELNHRVKNTLASIQAIAEQTIRRSAGLPEFRGAFLGRLLALSSSHDALTGTGWVSADLHELVISASRPFCEPARLDLRAERLALGPRAILTLGLVLHELCTNAAKYGALSTPAGRIVIDWWVAGEEDGRVVHFRWTETDGPAVVPPRRSGFGSRFIVASVQHELNGRSEIDYRPDGVAFSAEFPYRPPS